MWVRSKDRRPVDWRWLVIQADATPVVFRYGLPFISKGEQAWFPTMELSISFKQRPRPGTEWIAQSCVCRTLMNGRHENDTELWDEEGRLLAMSRETALVVVSGHKTLHR